MALDMLVPNFTRCEEAPRTFLNDEKAMGIELEYEQVCLSDGGSVPKGWYTAGDGSLRDAGVEFISHPIPWDATDEYLSNIEPYLIRTSGVATERCGLHVHINMRPFNVSQMWSLFTLYALMEPTIYQTYALEREDNMFALPLAQNQAQVRAMAGDISNLRNEPRGPLRSFAANTCKYSAMNLSSLAQFGTVEMRQPYCTTNFDAIRSWVDFLKRMTEEAEGTEDPIHVLDRYEREGIDSFQEQLMGVTYGVDLDEQEAAEDAAYHIAGYEEPAWDTLEWDEPIMEVG